MVGLTRNKVNWLTNCTKPIMKTLKLRFFYKPGSAHLESILIRCERWGKEAPQFGEPVPSDIKPFWYLPITYKEADHDWWTGFYESMDYCVNNRQITVGTEK